MLSPTALPDPCSSNSSWSLVKKTRLNPRAIICKKTPFSAGNLSVLANPDRSDIIVTSSISYPSIDPSSFTDMPDTPVHASSKISLEAYRQLIRDYFAKSGRKLRRIRDIFLPVPNKPWKRLSPTEKAKRYIQALYELDTCVDVTFRIDRKLLQRAKSKGRSELDYFRRRIHKDVSRALGKDAEFFLVGEYSRKGEFHLHGIFSLRQDEYERAKKAFWKALGKYDVEARNKQFKIRANPDFGWLGYILKDSLCQQSTRTSGLLKMAQQLHDDQRSLSASLQPDENNFDQGQIPPQVAAITGNKAKRPGINPATQPPQGEAHRIVALTHYAGKLPCIPLCLNVKSATPLPARATAYSKRQRVTGPASSMNRATRSLTTATPLLKAAAVASSNQRWKTASVLRKNPDNCLRILKRSADECWQ